MIGHTHLRKRKESKMQDEHFPDMKLEVRSEDRPNGLPQEEVDRLKEIIQTEKLVQANLGMRIRELDAEMKRLREEYMRSWKIKDGAERALTKVTVVKSVKVSRSTPATPEMTPEEMRKTLASMSPEEKKKLLEMLGG